MTFLEKIAKAKKIISDYYNSYAGLNCAVACSFGKDSMVVLDIALQVDPNFQVFSIMTPFKPKETLQYKARMEQAWKLNIKTYQQKLNPLHIRPEDIPYYAVDPDGCCNYYKVEPTREAIKDMQLEVWITGLRRTEGRTRTDYDYEEHKGGLIKLNPILDFTETDVWRYLAINNIPVNELYKRGYRSLGCEPCSTPEKDEWETERAGRWKGTSKCGGECGLHTKDLTEGVNEVLC